MNSSDAGAAAHPVDSGRVAPVIYLFGKAQVTVPTVVHDHVEAGPVAASEGSPLQETARAASLDRNQRTVDTFQPISNSSMYALGRRAMSSQEMRDYLAGQDFGVLDIDLEIERLERVDLLDDALLAQELAENLRRRKGLGRSALTAELKRRQLSPLVIEGALDDGEEHDELQQAITLAMKRAPQLRALDATTARRRLGDFLMRKGYSGQLVSKAVQAALASPSSGGPTFR